MQLGAKIMLSERIVTSRPALRKRKRSDDDDLWTTTTTTTTKTKTTTTTTPSMLDVLRAVIVHEEIMVP
jgi:hypothetical protein